VLLPDKILLVKSLGGYWPSFQDEMLVVICFLEASKFLCVGNLVVNVLVIFVSHRPYVERDLESCLVNCIVFVDR
jgi:hypothetical protein